MASNKLLFILLGLIIICGFTMFVLGQFKSTCISNVATKSSCIVAPQGTIHVSIADTAVLQENGLSDRPSMPDDSGMLFIFPTARNYAFWMKDMRFPLDMVWIDSDHMVVGVTENISTSTYPETFGPPSPVPFVLELNAGAAERFGIATGTTLKF